jgi:hypothetical protein
MSSALFMRVITHLLPTGAAWRLGFQKQIQKFFNGLTGLPSDARDFADAVYQDLFPSTTRELALWEAEFGLVADPSDSVRRLNLAAAWKAGGGQSPSYIQGVLQTAGFNVFVHEWWASGPPFVARDPRTYTTQPLIGTFQCSPHSFGANQPQCTPTTVPGGPTCDAFLANEVGYLVNIDLTRRAPPRVPDDPNTWPFFIYISAASFPTHATVPASRRAELERLVLKLRPTQQWVVMLVNYV